MIHPDYKKYADHIAAIEAARVAVESGARDLRHDDNLSDFPFTQSHMIHRTGNLLDFAEAGMFDVVVQGCNCFNAMGGGIAREIRIRYPAVAEADRITKYADYSKLGNWTECDAGENNRFTVINAYTQYETSNGKDVFEYTAFELILQKLAHEYPTARFGFPYIGMGLAQGNKHRIMAMLQNFTRTIYTSGGSVTLVQFG